MCTLAVTVLFPSFSSCTSRLFFFLGTTLHRGISGSKCPTLGLAFTKAFSFPCASTGLHTLCFFFRDNTTSGDLWIQMITTRRYIQLGQVFISLRFLWTPHSANLVFVKHNTASGDLWIQMTRCGTRIHLGISFPCTSSGLHTVQISTNSPKIVKYGILLQFHK